MQAIQLRGQRISFSRTMFIVKKPTSVQLAIQRTQTDALIRFNYRYNRPPTMLGKCPKKRNVPSASMRLHIRSRLQLTDCVYIFSDRHRIATKLRIYALDDVAASVLVFQLTENAHMMWTLSCEAHEYITWHLRLFLVFIHRAHILREMAIKTSIDMYRSQHSQSIGCLGEQRYKGKRMFMLRCHSICDCTLYGRICEMLFVGWLSLWLDGVLNNVQRSMTCVVCMVN